jgi:hypothetical protein
LFPPTVDELPTLDAPVSSARQLRVKANWMRPALPPVSIIANVRTILNYSVVRAKAAKAGGGELILVAPMHEVKRLLFTAASLIPIFGTLETALVSVER